MIDIQEVHEVKYKINLDAEKLAPVVYFEMIKVFDILDKTDSKEDIKKSIGEYYNFINDYLFTSSFDDVEYILRSERYRKAYINDIIMLFAGYVIDRLIKKIVPVDDPDIYRHCIFDDDNGIYAAKSKIVKIFANTYDNIYQKMIEKMIDILKKHNYAYSEALKIATALGLDIDQCVYVNSRCS